MADTQSTQRSSRTERFIRGAGEVREDPDNKLWAPARWVVGLIQYLIAIIMITIGKSLEAIFSGETPKKRRTARQESQGHKDL